MEDIQESCYYYSKPGCSCFKKSSVSIRLSVRCMNEPEEYILICSSPSYYS